MIDTICALCKEPMKVKAQRMKNSKSKLIFCSRSHKDRALKHALQGDLRFLNLIPEHYQPTKKCFYCDRWLKKGKYCSRSCQNNKRRQEVRQEWYLDASKGSNPDGSLRVICRKIILEDNHHRCSKCGWSEVSANQTIPVEVDHIDGNWRNNDYKNLRVLCPNCHALTPNWKAYNKGTTDQSRYSYYKERGWW
jgi:hypothetical protein